MLKPIPPKGTVVKEKLPFMDRMFLIVLVSFVFIPIPFIALGSLENLISEKERKILSRENFSDKIGNFKFVKVEFDIEEGTSYIKLREGEVSETREVTKVDRFVLEDSIMLDFDKDGKLIGVEVIRRDRE